MAKIRLHHAIMAAMIYGGISNSAIAQPVCCRVLAEPAVKVRDPAHVTLISITSAGHRLVAVGEHGVIIYSDDNGKDWLQARVPVDVTLTAVSFPTAADGWAVGNYGVVLHSVDGGKTWQKQLDGNQVNALAMTAAQATMTDNSKAPGAPLAIRRAEHFLNDGPSEPFLTIWAPDAKDAIVFGAYRMADKTTDGGKIWTDWSLNIGDSFSHNLYDATAIGNAVCIAAEAGLVFCSEDNGQTFTKLTPTGDATLLGILPTGDGGMLTFGIAGSAYRTEDHGKSWTNVNVGASANLTAGTVLISGAIVIVDQAGNIHVSHDHGTTFSVLPEHASMSLYDLTQADNGDVVVVGNTGVLIVPGADFS